MTMMSEHLQKMGEQLKVVADAAKPLYDSLTDAQKRDFGPLMQRIQATRPPLAIVVVGAIQARTGDRKSMIATAIVASVRAQTACRSRWFEPHGDRPWFLHAGLSQCAHRRRGEYSGNADLGLTAFSKRCMPGALGAAERIA